MWKKSGLTGKMLIYTASIGLVVWFISDYYQTRTLKEIFHEKLQNRFSIQAQEHRTLFDRYIKIHNQAAKLLASSDYLHHYIVDQKWQPGFSGKYKLHEDSPEWLPNISTLRKFVLPRYTFIMDVNNKVRELYYWNGVLPPNEILHPDPLLVQLSENQSYLTTLSGKPYLFTSEPIVAYGKRVGTLAMASPIDSDFMIESQILSISKYTVALLAEDEETILVSSDPKMVPEGVKVSELSNVYQTIGEGFFDYGSSDLVIKCVSFIPLQEVQDLTHAVLVKERQMRSISMATYVLAFMLIMFYLTKRLLNMTHRVVEFSERMEIQQPKIEQKDELKILEERFKLLASAIKSETEALEYQASHDPLTDLPNRKMLNERLQSTLLRSKVSQLPLVLIISDLNHFKEINDTLGHHIGDLVLQQAAERLYNTVRKTDTVARLGGDEFSILLPDTNIDEAQRIARNITEIFKIPFVAEGHNLNVGISIGLAESPTHGDDVNILVQRADVAMYDAKRGKKGFAVYDPEQDTHNISKLELMSELRESINSQNIDIHYQAKQDIMSGKLIGAEALLRWVHQERGLIQPDDIIPLAEQTGLIKPLTRIILDKAIHQCAEWHKIGYKLSVSVNVSVHCLHGTMLTRALREFISKYKLPPEYCILEITESDIMVDPIRAKNILMEIDSIGAHISIDDFGTGYSSLAYLKQLPVSEIKIDRSFVMEIENDENDKVIIRTIIDLAHNLGLDVVAEGVETDTALALLKTLGCNIAQGYFIGRPVSGDDFTAKLGKHPSSISLQDNKSDIIETFEGKPIKP
ncbi:MAG: EAL domain-containing protein [Gammaproteobacteria bacterium]|nr:EAL domain-containing protein [Gammaproteobacteria bacterium]